MSLNIRYLTNGKITAYTVTNSGVTPSTFEIFKNREDIDIRIRHYAKETDPVYCDPDIAKMFGVRELFYPDLSAKS